MHVAPFPHCCGAAIFYGFAESQGMFGWGDKYVSRDEFVKNLQRLMHLAHNPTDQKTKDIPFDAWEWRLGRISVIYAILTHYQQNARTILEELGWRPLDESVRNANSGNNLQLYVYHVKP